MQNVHKALMILLAISLLPLVSTSVNAAEPTVITLTQTGCQFTEPEDKDHGFKTMGSADCKAINSQSGKKRLAASKTITLKPGKYVFRVKKQGRALPTRVLSARRRHRTPHPAEGLGGRPREGEIEGLSHHPERGRLLLFMPPEPDARLQSEGDELDFRANKRPNRLRPLARLSRRSLE